ncbi:MAG: ribose 5-phosphate isomerase B [Ruminococcaceae bacterium]|nr:ribose 5-phosphate isomerase B [Oscillospiraceae bacterium]
MANKTIVLACDHAALDLKKKVITHLEDLGYATVDVGTHTTDSCAYPEYASAACQKIQNGEADLGILICGTGIGMGMAANKHRGIRAAICSDTFSASATRLHNDANVLCFGARVVGEGVAMQLVDAFIGTEYEGGRHQSRVDMLTAIEEREARR